MMDVRFFTGGLGKLMILDENEVWLCDNRDSCAPAGDMMCYVYSEQLERFPSYSLEVAAAEQRASALRVLGAAPGAATCGGRRF